MVAPDGRGNPRLLRGGGYDRSPFLVVSCGPLRPRDRYSEMVCTRGIRMKRYNFYPTPPAAQRVLPRRFKVASSRALTPGTRVFDTTWLRVFDTTWLRVFDTAWLRVFDTTKLSRSTLKAMRDHGCFC